LLEARTQVAERRVIASDARAALHTLIREAEMAARRRQAIAADIALWTERSERAGGAAVDLQARLTRLRGERTTLLAAPDTFVLRRRALLSAIAEAEGKRRDAADRLAEGEGAQAGADRARAPRSRRWRPRARRGPARRPATKPRSSASPS
jgi:chromosome segregation protein